MTCIVSSFSAQYLTCAAITGGDDNAIRRHLKNHIGSGEIPHEQARLHAETEFEKFRIIQDQLFVSDCDRHSTFERQVFAVEDNFEEVAK